MGKKILVAVVVVVAISVYLTIREQGVENAYGGVFSPLETVRDASLSERTMDATGYTSSSLGGGQSSASYRDMSNRVRNRVNAAMKKSVDRSSR